MSTVTPPKISVLLAVYNGERYVGESIRSVLGQSYENFELVVVNDGSTDGSRDIVTSFDDRRIRIIDQENRGLTNALIRASSSATGSIIARQDADDVSAPERFARQLDLLSTSPEIVAVGTDREQVDESGRSVGRYGHPVENSWLRTIMALRNEFGHGSLMMRADVFREVGGYDPSIRFAQDFDLMWRMSRAGKVYNHPQVLYFSRKHNQSISSVNTGAQRACADAIRLRNTVQWLENRNQITVDLGELGVTDALVAAFDDDWADNRRERFANLLGQFGAALLIAGRRDEARLVLNAASSLAGFVSRENLVSIITRLAPGIAQNWIRNRSRKFELYNVYYENDLG